MEFLEWDEANQQQQEAEAMEPLDILFEGGLIRKIQNPKVLERCLELLDELRDGIEADGFNREWDSEILMKTYGRADPQRLHDTLFDFYIQSWSTSQVSEDEREREGYASPAQCKKNILQEIDDEIRRLN